MNSTAELFRDLNDTFYGQSPSNYLRMRISSVIAMCDEDGTFQHQLNSGYTAWGMRAWGRGEHDEDAVQHYGTIESLAIVHLAAEALLRMYLAHAEADPCPPLRLAGLTSFRAFKSRCTELLQSAPALDQLRAVFRGTLDCPPGLSQSEWDDDADALPFLLSSAASLVINDAAAYNSTKHGLAARPAESGLEIGSDLDDPGEPLLNVESHSVRYLVRGGGTPHTGVQWEDRTTFVSPGRHLLFASAFADQIDSLYSVARARLYGDQIEVALVSRALKSQLEEPPFGDRAGGVLSLSLSRTFTLLST